MELRQLKTLVSIIDCGGFAAAGDAIGLTQSAVSLQIKALEEELGSDLFDRSKRPPQPNAKAIALVRKSREILRMCSDLSEFTEEQLSGSLQLGAVPSVQATILPDALKKLRLSHPDLFISIEMGLSDELTRSVYRGVLDAAIISGPTTLSPGMSWHPFVSETLVVITPESHKGDDIVDILQTKPYIRFKRNTWTGELIASTIKDLNIKVKSVVETDSLDSVWNMVACGMGVSVVPYFTHKNNSADDSVHDTTSHRPENVRIVSLGDNSVELITGLVQRSTDPKSRLLQALYEAFAH